ncbi:GRP domain-containing protein [Cephalotus follicularis]|uniref:GRP domain-containing protein n=1 Tax=Cephalotus follicularis TaxID=3775 RepID=A0A1Q3B3E8_CEPFO|nr:GRP domain-containing protein [Cephalotus follicularis]
MGFKVFLFLGLLSAIVLLISSNVAARDLAETSTEEANKETNGVNDAKYGDDRGGWGGGHEGGWRGPGGGYEGGRGGGYRGGGGRGYGYYHGCCSGGVLSYVMRERILMLTLKLSLTTGVAYACVANNVYLNYLLMF